eukprot:1161044-Pelagomonas_calceolata.AAC.5
MQSPCMPRQYLRPVTSTWSRWKAHRPPQGLHTSRQWCMIATLSSSEVGTWQLCLAAKGPHADASSVAVTIDGESA